MPFFSKLYHHRVLRFLVSGGTGATVNLALLYFLTDIVGWWYLFAATVAYPVSFAVGFTLQKYWTFTDNSSDRIHRQAVIYITVVVINIFINNSILLILIERYGFHYLIAQVFASLIVATWSFFIYRWLFQGKVGKSMKKIIYIANIRLPTEKAHGLATMKMCEAFAMQGSKVELVVPHRRNALKGNPFRHYEMEESFSITKLPTLDLVRFGKIGFWIQASSFALCAFWYTLLKKSDVIYGRDELSLSFLSFFKKNVVWEIHTIRKKLLVGGLLKRSKKLVAISNGLKEHYALYGVSKEKILVAPSGLDIDAFERITDSKEELRKKLNLPLNKKIVAYVGKLKTMGKEKGVSELDTVIRDVKKDYPEAHLLVVSNAKPKEIPFFMKAADILVMNYPNVEHYAKYMSPLKMFEYMASGNPIVTTDLPSIREILDEDRALLVPPGDSAAFGAGIKRLLADEGLRQRLSLNAYDKVQAYTWEKRTQRIITFLQHYES